MESNPKVEAKLRPESRIRVRAMAVAKRDGRLLVCEVLDDNGAVTGWVPLGGDVQFGETAEAAVQREVREELGVDCVVSGPATICENLFEHCGARGHEIVFAFPITFVDPQIYAKMRFQFSEDSGTLHYAEWVAIERFKSYADTLFPRAMVADLTAEQ